MVDFPSRAGRLAPLLAPALGLGLLALLWPGVATYDTVVQYAQAVSGQVDDWHPPILVRLWQGLRALGLDGTGPLLALQFGLFWSGLGLFALGLREAGRPRLAAATALVGLVPPLLGWMFAVLKDGQLIGAAVMATGLVARYRLACRPLPRWVGLIVALLLGYALLLRANAVFGMVPLALGLACWGGFRHPLARLALLAAATLAALAAAGPINHRVLGADRSLVEGTLPLFDMAGIAHRAGLPSLPQLPPAAWRAAEARGCYTPFFWDSFGDARRCGAIGTRLIFDRDEEAPSIFADWLGLVVRHPLAYAAHRLAHLNATLRIAWPADERLATAPARSQPSPARLGTPARAAAAVIAHIATIAARTPLGAPWLWLVAALGLLWMLAATPAQPARSLGLTLAWSAVLQTASFAVVSIASDLRYHLWLITATALAALCAAACRDVPPRRRRAALATLAAAAALSVTLRGV